MAADEVAAHRALRRRRLVLAAATSLALRPVSLLASLAAVPIFITALGGGEIGQERYGLCLALAAAGSWVSISGGGFAQGLINRLTECYVSGNRELARQYVSTMFVTLAIVGAATAALFCAVAAFIPWDRVLSASPGVATGGEILAAVVIAASLTALAMVVGISTAVYAAYQELHLANLWDVSTRAGLLFGAGIVAVADLGVPAAVGAMVGGPLSVRVLSAAFLFGRHSPWLRPSFALARRSLARGLIAQGGGFFTLQLSWMALNQTSTFLVAAFVNVAEAAVFGVVSQLAQMLYTVFLSVAQPQWPAYGEALHRGDWPWVRTSYRATTAFGVALAVLFAAAMLIAGDWIVDVWTRGAINSVAASLALAVAAAIGLRMWVDARSSILNAAGIIRPQLFVYGSYAALSLALSLLFVTAFDWGAAGVAWGQVAGGLATSAWGYVWLIRRFERGLART